MKENFMERNKTAIVFDTSAHCSGYRKMWGTGLECNLLKSIESDPIDFDPIDFCDFCVMVL
jgi:hypothetical protein